MKFIKWIDSHKLSYLIAIVSFIIVPVSVEYSSLFYGKHQVQGDWLSFWGSYLGMIPSGLIAYFIAKQQVAFQAKIQKKTNSERLKLEKSTKIYQKAMSIRSDLRGAGQEYRMMNHIILCNKENEVKNIDGKNIRRIINSAFGENKIFSIIGTIDEIVYEIESYKILEKNICFTDKQLETLDEYQQTLKDSYDNVLRDDYYNDVETEEPYPYTESYVYAFLKKIEELDSTMQSLIHVIKIDMKK